MKKYYNKEIPTEIYFVYGGRYAGKTYREFEKLKTRINELEEKNKKLKEKYDYIVKENRSWYEKWKKLLNRINEAVEYIEQWRDVKTKRIDNRLKRTLEILIGKSK